MAKSSRSSSPQALSVASVTEPGDVKLTVERMLEFDDAKIGFTHAKTWGAMPAARRGVIKSASSHLVYPGTHPRVEACIRALCELGERSPVETRRFTDFPQAGLTTTRKLEWGPSVILSVKGVCWYVIEETPVIPLLQPRKSGLSDEKICLYAALGQKAYCHGDWANGRIEIVDLSGDGDVHADVIAFEEIAQLSDARIREFVDTYLAAKDLVDKIRAARPKPETKRKGGDLFDPPPP